MRADLALGCATAYIVEVAEVIEVEEAGDEGPTFFVRTRDGEVIVLAGQWLARPVIRGFPWTRFAIREAPRSRALLGLTKRGDSIAPSAVRPPLGSEAMRRLGYASERWKVLEVGFDELVRA